MMRLATSPSRFVILWLMSWSMLGTFLEEPLRAQEAPLSEEEKREQVAAERFLQLLLRRPTTGTALERVFGYHVARGNLSELLTELEKKAEQAAKEDEEQTAGNHWMVIGLLQLQRGEEAAAAEALAKAEAALKDNPLTAYHHGQAMLLLGKDEAAALAMQRAVDLKPPRQDFLNIATQLGSLYQRAGKADAALGIWKQLEDSFPGDDGVRQRIARALADEGDLANALKRYEDLAKEARSPNDRIVFALRSADLRVQLGQKEQATKDLETLLTRLRPGSYLYAEARRRIENAFLDSGDYAGLAEYYEKWIGEHPDDVGAVLRLARTLSIQGRGTEALKWLEKAIERSPSDRAPRQALVETYIAEARYAEAAAQYEKLAEMEPKNPDHLVRWGQIVLEDPKPPKEQRKTAAAAIWKRLADARPDEAVIQSQVADLLRGAELKEEAIAGYRKAIELAPHEPQYKEYLGEYLHRLDRHAEALPVWRSIAEGELRTRENLVRLAEVLHQFDEPEEALETLGKACEMDPTITERLHYAEWLRDTGSHAQALKQLELAGEQTDTIDDRDKVFTEEVKTYQAAGQLEDRITEARKKAEAEMNNGESWRRLAILCDANNQTRESLEAIENAVKHSGDSIETLNVAARMYETAGRLQNAIEKRRLLADTDRRFRSGHLQRLASLYLRMGRAEEAIATGKLVLAGGGGSLESFKFYADLCGQIGRTEERLDTYRRCLRLNPRSTEALQLLAGQLAEDFKTDQAIELYWNMLDSSSELEDRRGVVRSLTDLYLRSNRLDQLISRLEIRGRESGDRRATIDLMATAYEQAGDLGLAREALEGLLREQGRDTLLLDRLVALAEKAGEAEEAVELQRQLLRLAPNRQSEAKLASLLIDIGAMDEAEVLWMRLSEQSADRDLTTRNLNRLFAAGETEVAIRLAKKVLDSDPNDWETQFQLMVLEASEGQWEQAVKTANTLRSLEIEDTALPAGGKPYQSTVTHNGQTYPQPPLKFLRTQRLYELYQMLDDRYGYRQTSTLPKPMDFGHAKVMALWVVLKDEHGQGDLKTRLENVAMTANAEGATPEDVWNWYITVSVVGTMDSSFSLNYQKPETWGPLWKLVEVDPQAGSAALTNLLYSRWSNSIRGRNVTLSPLAEDKLAWLKEKAREGDSSDLMTSWYGNISWPLIHDNEMRIAGHEENAKQRTEDFVSEVLKKKDLKQAVGLITLVLNQSDDEQLWSLIELLRKNSQDPAVKGRYSSDLNTTCLAMFASQIRIDKELTQGPGDATYRKRVMTLLDAMLADEAAKPMRRSSIRLTSLGQTRSTYVIRGSSYEQITIPFPPQGLGPNDQFIQTLWTMNGILKDHADGWTKRLQAEDPEADPRLKILRKVVAGMVLEWNEQTGPAIQQLSEAVKIAEKEIPHSESELRLLWVDLLLRQGQKRQALEVIDGLTVYDQNTMAVREFAAAKLAAALDDKERAQTAAKRLFGVRLDTDAQIELAKLMRSLDMHELSSDLVRRMRSRGGNNTEQLNSLMTYFVAQGDKEQAAEVAVELLRRSVPSRRQSSNSTTVTEARRRSALQTLANVGRLTSLIKATEERLKRSPKSQRIRGELAEMYVSAGQTAKAQELLGDSISGDTNSLAALQQAAKQLASGGKMDEACDAYLKILRRKPELFRQDYYEVKRPFEQAKRMGDLADLIIDVGVKRFESHRVGELCQELSRDDKQSEKVKLLFLAMLETPPSSSNAMRAIHQVISYGRTALKDEEVIAKTQDYMIQASLRSTGEWGALFDGYSTSGDGRHRNAAMSLVETVGENEKHAQALEDLIRKTLKENEDWYEGRAWLGTLLVVRKQYEEAKKLLEPLLDEQTKPAPTYTVFWLIGSLIDKHKPMQELALKMYQHALDNHAAEIHGRGSEFAYTLGNRACQLMKDMGKRAEARELVLTSIAEREKAPNRYSSNDDYEAYRQIQERNSLIVVLKEIDYPADALRLARTFDMSLFDKAGRYERGQRDSFLKQRDELLQAVRKLGGLATVESMIEAETSEPRAVDLGITVGERPFTETGIQSLWIEMLEEARNKPKLAEDLKTLVQRLKDLQEKRPADDSLALAHAIAADVANDREPLRGLLQAWMANAEAEQIDDPAFRRQALILGAVYLGRSDAEEDQRLAKTIASRTKDWNWEHRMLLLAELGRQALARNDQTTAKELWEGLLTDPQSQLMLLDLAHAAALSQMPILSCDAAGAAAMAPERALSATTPRTNANSLGSLLSTRNRQSSSSSNNQDQLDPAEVRFAQRVLELDDVWQANKTAPRKASEALMKIVFGENGTRLKPLCVPVEVRPNHNLLVDSVYDRLARRAQFAKLTDEILAKLPNEDAASHLLAGLALLRNEQSDEALKHYAKVDPAGLNALPKEAVLQALLPALDDDVCRGESLRIGIAFVGQNKPTQRYQNIDPFDTLAFNLARTALQNKHVELGLRAINDYLEICQHQNDRYSGTSGLTRRIEQLNNVSRLLANNAHVEKALDFAGMRQSLFAMGLDTSDDAIGKLLLQRLEGMKDRNKVYRILADWTFAGDGPLNGLSAIVHRQPLPDWIPESVGGKYPKFSPVASRTFPIVSNYYALAKLAVETNQTADLLKRLRDAHQNQRASSAEALAIALAVTEQSVPKELLAEIDKRMDSTGPGTDQVKTALPLAAMQLATILAPQSQHADWAREIASKFEKHGGPRSRRFIMRWVSRYRHERGWLEESKLMPAEPLVHWLASSSAPARDYAEGLTPPVWLTDGKSLLTHLCGIGDDRLWFRYPLAGDFEFQVELTDGGWRESSVLANGLRFGSNAYAKGVDVASPASRDWVRFPASIIRQGKWNQHAFRFEGDTLTYLVNGTPIYKEPRRKGMPWIALHSEGLQSPTGARNFRFTGEPRVLREVNLLPDDSLRDWSGQYFGQALPSAKINEDVHQPDAQKAIRYRTAPKAPQLNQLAWTMKNGELISGNEKRPNAFGPKFQSVIRHDRPLGDGETLTYEFHYEAGKMGVHPSIGRTAYLLRPEGVHRHWMTEAGGGWKLPKDFEVPAHSENPIKVPLKEADWNQVTLHLKDSRLQIRVNDVLVFDQRIEILPQGALFGFFHYADKTKARVRNITLTGPWPEALPENLFTHREQE